MKNILLEHKKIKLRNKRHFVKYKTLCSCLKNAVKVPAACTYKKNFRGFLHAFTYASTGLLIIMAFAWRD
jgi:hypothetical protein